MPGLDSWTTLAPELALIGGAVLLLIMDSITPGQRGRHLGFITIITLVVGAWLATQQWGEPPGFAMGFMVVHDNFGVFIRWVIMGAAALATFTAHGYLRPRGLDKAEFYALLLLSTAGMTMLSISADLIMVFLSIELLSLALYVMAGFERTKPEAQEASMKYFLLGAFSSAFLLYGIAFIFGGGGTTNLLRLRVIAAAGGLDDFQLTGVAVALIVVGLGFKAAMVPFHMWTPDVYQGAPTPVTAFMAGGTKAAAFAALIRTLVVSLGDLRWDWQPALAIIAVLTVGFASVIAVAQTDIKRMLAYSSIAHTGFIAIAVLVSTRAGVAATLLYLLVYTAMTIGSFACVMLFKESGGPEVPGGVVAERTHLAKYSGLGVKRPAAAALFAFFLFSLAGIPPTGGFWAKWYVFFAAIRGNYTWLALVAIASSVVAAFFYIRVAVVMFMQEPAEADDDMPLDDSAGLRVTLALCALVVIAVGVAPEYFLHLAEKAASFAG